MAGGVTDAKGEAHEEGKMVTGKARGLRFLSGSRYVPRGSGSEAGVLGGKWEKEKENQI